MAWNEPGGGRNNQDPWRGRDGRGQSSDLDDVIKKLQDRFGGMFGGGGSNNNDGGFGLIALVLVVLLLAWFVSGIYRVEQAEEAVVLRFGKYHETVGAGLHWNPWGIDRVMTVDVNERNSMPVRATVLTEDQNIIDIVLQVQFVVMDSKAFFLESSNPIDTLKNSVESALRHVVGGNEMDYVLTDGREEIAIKVHQRLQGYLERYKTGLSVDKLNIEDAHPPKDVKDAFDKVIKAKEKEEQAKNVAQAHANKVVPEARGEAQKVIENANAYKVEVVERARGEADRFSLVYGQYKLAPEVTRRRLYLETMETIYADTSKVLVDLEGGNNVMYLPIDKILENARQTKDVAPRQDSGNRNSKSSSQSSDARGIDRLRQSRDSRWEGR